LFSDSVLPLDGSTNAAEWQGYYPPERKPRVVNPMCWESLLPVCGITISKGFFSVRSLMMRLYNNENLRYVRFGVLIISVPPGLRRRLISFNTSTSSL